MSPHAPSFVSWPILPEASESIPIAPAQPLAFERAVIHAFPAIMGSSKEKKQQVACDGKFEIFCFLVKLGWLIGVGKRKCELQ
jgi:hypothetical protein